MREWKSEMKKIAEECPNVVVKVGGFMPQLGHGFSAREAPPSSKEVAEVVGDMCRFTISSFGSDRCMFESNFPVDKGGISYAVLWNAFKLITKDLPEQDRALLFSGTAKRVYGLK